MTMHDDFYTLVDAATSHQVVFANENGKRPERPFITLQVSVGAPQPIHRGPVDDDGLQRISAHRPVTVQLQCYGAGSWGVLDELQLKLYTDSMSDLAESLNIALQREPRLQDVPALLDDTKYESRAILDLEAMYTAGIDDDVGYIETVNGTIETTPGIAPELDFTMTLP
ncbi:hypothetical protein CSC67_08680 [Pusillimonas caeni]|uniref:phage neck terminator protein n=1 Tax=Pusillimonas caeni TaxID=1348472 RepID=UPI000E59C79C|nr:hypothetical protein [Pusillimonas caeni]TFL14217.1 hypothetical protein CSC67_08680 [Pusillimonas caeni]